MGGTRKNHYEYLSLASFAENLRDDHKEPWVRAFAEHLLSFVPAIEKIEAWQSSDQPWLELEPRLRANIEPLVPRKLVEKIVADDLQRAVEAAQKP